MSRNNKFMTIIIIKMVILSAPLWIAFDSIAMLLSSICYGINTIVVQLLFDSVQGVVQEQKTIMELTIISIAVIIFKICNELLNSICNFTWAPASKTVERKLNRVIHEKISKLPANIFEDVDKLECITKAEQGIGICYGVYNCIATLFFFYLPYFIIMALYLWKLRPLLVISIFFVFIPTIITLWIRKNIFTKFIDESIPLQRKWLYFENELCGKEHYKENRLLGTFEYFKTKYLYYFNKYSRKKIKANKKIQLIELILRMLSLIGYVGVLILLFNSLLQQYISVGAFAAIFTSIATMVAFMNDAISNYLGGMFDNIGGINNLIDFLNMPEEEGENICIDWDNDIVLQGVTYSYYGSENKVIDNIHLTIKKGETLAIVGENGAGKSTLVKIIMGLYKPSSGKITVGNVNLYNVNKKQRFTRVSAVFQNFQKYKMTLRENIVISNMNEYCNDSKIEESLRNSDFNYNGNRKSLPKGLDTMLCREFEGVDLSGGQWQRVAISRSSYKNSSLIILDEPTSAIDPIEENRLIKQFINMSKGKTSIIVTHRLTLSKIADRILVLEKGKIKEMGSHKELLRKNGIYALMYKEQSKWYKKK